MKKVILVIGLFSLLFFSGCIEKLENTFKQPETTQELAEKIIVDRNVPVLTYQAEKIVYYFCKDENAFDYCVTGWNKYAAYSKMYLHCQVKAMDENLTGYTVTQLMQHNVNIAVLFDRETTLTPEGYPRLDSEYGTLLRNLADVQLGKVTESFCVSERGVLFGSFEPSREKTPYPSSFYVVWSQDFAKPVNERFFKNFEAGT